MKNFLKRHKILSWFSAFILGVLILFGGFVTYLTVTEYKPELIEEAMLSINKDLPKINKDELTIMTYNIGYGGLGEESDFVLDGGKTSGASDPITIDKNMTGIKSILENNKADIYMLQEIDLDSDRTFNVNQIKYFEKALKDYEWQYARNFYCNFVPFPLPNMIKGIDSGIITYANYLTSDSYRVALPSPFKWPIRTANLKRCLLVSRFPIENSDKEVVIINFHLEAYDDGEGKIMQTNLLLNILEEEYNKGNYVIAGGDFNQIFPEVETLVKETSKWVPGKLDPLPSKFSEFKYVYDDSIPTCRLLNEPYNPDSPLTQYYVIDGFITSPNVEVRSIKTLHENFKYSDHNPVMLEIKLKS